MENKELFLLAKSLIDIRSDNGKEKGVAEFLVNFLEDNGFSVEKQQVLKDRFNIIASVGNPRFYFQGHMDTVGGGNAFAEDKKYIYGRGACDVKGIIASMLTAGVDAKKNGMSDFGYVFTVGEEVDFAGSKKIAREKKLDSFMVVAEPTELKPVSSHYGIVVLNLQFKGKAVHTSNPQLGKNAIIESINFLNRLGKEKVHKESSMTLTNMNGGIADNIVPDSCKLTLSIRVSPNDKTDYVSLMKKLIKKNNAQLNVELDIAPVSTKIPTSLSFLGKGQEVKYCTDLSYLGNGVVLGPGSIKYAHAKIEKIPKKELLKSVEIYKRIIKGF